MSNRLTYDGMEEFKAALRQLPVELSRDGGDIVVRRSQEALDEIVEQYQNHSHSGNLASHVRLEVQQQSAGARAVLKSTAKHAVIFENGTQVRKNAAGKNLGAMPPAHIFVPTARRKRAEMVEDLVDLLKRAGLEVSLG